MCSFICHTVVLPVTTSSAACNPHADAITVIVVHDYSRGYLNLLSGYIVLEIFHPLIHCASEEDTHTRTKRKTCCFDFETET
jgi:hypothetical protein